MDGIQANNDPSRCLGGTRSSLIESPFLSDFRSTVIGRDRAKLSAPRGPRSRSSFPSSTCPHFKHALRERGRCPNQLRGGPQGPHDARRSRSPCVPCGDPSGYNQGGSAPEGLVRSPPFSVLSNIVADPLTRPSKGPEVQDVSAPFLRARGCDRSVDKIFFRPSCLWTGVALVA